MNLTIEQMREIVDGAPETATHYNMNLGGHYAREGVLKMKTQWEWFNTINKEWYFDFAEHNHIALSDLHAAIADHNTKLCPHGYDIACLLCGFGNKDGKRVWNNRKTESTFDDDRTDYVTDIRNHIAPTTVVLDVHVNEALRLNRLG